MKMKIISYSVKEDSKSLAIGSSFIEYVSERGKPEGFLVSNTSPFDEEDLQRQLRDYRNATFLLTPTNLRGQFNNFFKKDYNFVPEELKGGEGEEEEQLKNLMLEKITPTFQSPEEKDNFIATLIFSDTYEIQTKPEKPPPPPPPPGPTYPKIIREPSFIIGLVVTLFFAWMLRVELPTLQKLQQEQIPTLLLTQAKTALHDNKSVYAKYWAQRILDIEGGNQNANAIVEGVRQVEEGKKYLRPENKKARLLERARQALEDQKRSNNQPDEKKSAALLAKEVLDMESGNSEAQQILTEVIDDFLGKAQTAFDAKNWITTQSNSGKPPHDNAMFWVNEVFKIKPDSSDASRLVTNIINKYENLSSRENLKKLQETQPLRQHITDDQRNKIKSLLEGGN